MNSQLSCPVCGGTCHPFDAVDFNKSCEEARGIFLPPAGIPIEYYLCAQCRFCYAPEFARWSMRDFEQKIYNDAYVQVDPDYREARPRANAQALMSMLGANGRMVSHLDYGGGNGMLSAALRQAQWRSRSYDPFIDTTVDPATLGQFTLVTAFEVFEHVPHVEDLMMNLSQLTAPEGVIFFSTLISDGNLEPHQRLTWWYASPRNGHISLFSRQALVRLGARFGFNFTSFSEGFHAYWREIPAWGQHLIRP